MCPWKGCYFIAELEEKEHTFTLIYPLLVVTNISSVTLLFSFSSKYVLLLFSYRIVTSAIASLQDIVSVLSDFWRSGSHLHKEGLMYWILCTLALIEERKAVGLDPSELLKDIMVLRSAILQKMLRRNIRTLPTPHREICKSI